ncbi:MAG: hypothetical protein ACXWWO_01210, partial [Candidatus Limnocylindria bacterium]
PIIEAITRAERRATDIGRHERVGPVALAHAAVDEARSRINETLDAVRESPGHRAGRQLRIRVTEHGRQVVNLRIPIGFVDAALKFVPGLAGDQSERIRDAVHAGATGPILDIEEPDGSGVLISVD